MRQAMLWGDDDPEPRRFKNLYRCIPNLGPDMGGIASRKIDQGGVALAGGGRHPEGSG